MFSYKSIIFLGLISLLVAHKSELRFLEEEQGYQQNVFLNGKEMIKGGTFKLKDRHVCVRGGTPANSDLMKNFNIDADGDACLPLICVENLYYRIRTSQQVIKFVCNTHGDSGIANLLRVSLQFHLDRANKMKVEDLVNQLKDRRGANKILYQEQVRIVEENVKAYNQYTVRWNNRYAKREELLISKKTYETNLTVKREEKKALEEEINKATEECRKKELALVEFNKRIFAVNRQIENLDIKHTENSDEILGLNDFAKNKAMAIEETNKRIAAAEKLFNESISLLKQYTPKASHDLALIEKAYSERNSDEIVRIADLITSVEPNN